MADLINDLKHTTEQAKLKLAETKGRVEQKAEDMKTTDQKSDYRTEHDENSTKIAGP